MDRGDALVGGVSVDGDVVGAAGVDDGGQAGRVELQCFDETPFVCRTAKMEVWRSTIRSGIGRRTLRRTPR